MAGIYIHIPFCHRKCAYCDFYKTTDLSFKSRFIDAILKELNQRKDFFQGESINTIYFGGGTPSVLAYHEIELILEKIGNLFVVKKNAEITFEANPDDLTPPYLKNLSETPVNRLSIGVQSFFENDLKMMNRRHNSIQASKCVEDAFDSGFENISIDLIYGLPGLNIDSWKTNLYKAFLLPVDHISAYHLTYHKGTWFYDLLKKGIIKEISEDDSIAQFEVLIEIAIKNGFEHYEISNFAKNEMYSKHNSSYWFNEKYLGIGPSAHSYDTKTRQWNISNLEKYFRFIESEKVFFEKEILSETDKFNDYIITRLRTKWGISEQQLATSFGIEKWNFLEKNIQPYLTNRYIIEKNGAFTLTQKGMFIFDKIMEALIFVET
ncbi:MAG: radical SAM family heme chaperone HemW [Mariniphaga sp.]|nr:radical SAM family heme chaperone HemW [Mariniphaga sp.]